MNGIKEFVQWIFDAIKIWIIIQPWESALRVRFGKHIKKLSGGVYLRLPYFDAIYIQENRLRVCTMSMQTLTTKDGETITIEAAVGYSISDLEKLYNTLYAPESTIENIIKSTIADYITSKNSDEVRPADIEEQAQQKISEQDYGLKFSYVKILSFARVKTFRLIQDSSWSYNSLELTKKK